MTAINNTTDNFTLDATGTSQPARRSFTSLRPINPHYSKEENAMNTKTTQPVEQKPSKNFAWSSNLSTNPGYEYRLGSIETEDGLRWTHIKINGGGKAIDDKDIVTKAIYALGNLELGDIVVPERGIHLFGGVDASTALGEAVGYIGKVYAGDVIGTRRSEWQPVTAVYGKYKVGYYKSQDQETEAHMLHSMIDAIASGRGFTLRLYSQMTKLAETVLVQRSKMSLNDAREDKRSRINKRVVNDRTWTKAKTITVADIKPEQLQKRIKGTSDTIDLASFVEPTCFEIYDRAGRPAHMKWFDPKSENSVKFFATFDGSVMQC